MNLKRGNGDYRVPKIGILDCVFIELHGNAHMVMRVQPEMIDAKRKETPGLLGIPFMFAHDTANDLIMFFPAADHDHKAVVRFYPPMVEA